MKIALYNPYLDTAGGGEKYILTAAEIISQKHDVSVLLDKHLSTIGAENIKQKIKKLHDIDFSKIKFLKAPVGERSSLLERIFFLKQFDILFYLTDGSIFYSTAKKSYIHFQVPFPNIEANSLWGKIKLSSWNLAIYNSRFTKNYVEKDWSIEGKVVYPPVSINLFKSLKKKKQIISVGRFFGYLKDKKQELLIDIFKDLVDKNNLDEWSMNLVGAASEGDKHYLEMLKRRGDGYKISILPNLPFEDLKKLYGESYIYWHAMGFGEVDPTKMEHFGMTIVEAMASGCIPIVVNKGGAKEIIDNEINGYLWNESEELESFTLKLIINLKLMNEMGRNAERKSKIFSKDKFAESILDLVKK